MFGQSRIYWPLTLTRTTPQSHPPWRAARSSEVVAAALRKMPWNEGHLVMHRKLACKLWGGDSVADRTSAAIKEDRTKAWSAICIRATLPSVCDLLVATRFDVLEIAPAIHIFTSAAPRVCGKGTLQSPSCQGEIACESRPRPIQSGAANHAKRISRGMLALTPRSTWARSVTRVCNPLEEGRT